MMSWNNDSNNEMQQVSAVADVNNLTAESSITDQEKTSVDLEPSLIKDNSRKEDETFPVSNPGILSKQFSGEDSRKGSESAESKVIATGVPDEKAIRRASSFKKPVTLADDIGSSSSTKPRGPQNPDLLSSEQEIVAAKPDLPTIKPNRAAPKPDLSTTKPVSTAPKPDHHPINPGTTAATPEQPLPVIPVAPRIEAEIQPASSLGTAEKKAEAWEKAEMAKIKERYEKKCSSILAWEEKKIEKARRKAANAEAGRGHTVSKMASRALIKLAFQTDQIKAAANGAREKAEESRRNDELKAKERANKIRETGKVPRTCFCC